MLVGKDLQRCLGTSCSPERRRVPKAPSKKLMPFLISRSWKASLPSPPSYSDDSSPPNGFAHVRIGSSPERFNPAATTLPPVLLRLHRHRSAKIACTRLSTGGLLAVPRLARGSWPAHHFSTSILPYATILTATGVLNGEPTTALSAKPRRRLTSMNTNNSLLLLCVHPCSLWFLSSPAACAADLA